jgi:hypothetical protein
MQQRKIDSKLTDIAQQSVSNMGSILIGELNESVANVDFEGMLSRSSALSRFAKNNTRSHLLMNDLKTMAQGIRVEVQEQKNAAF